jgi:2-dehydro-3-deoxyphosphogluconate aldolase/(4S)-4-hydroxy-2-oxoglutarate aldolase
MIDRIREERVVAVLRRVPDVDAAVAEVRAAGIAVVDAAVEAGAAAVVSPAFVPEVLARARERGVPAIPGALTPTEVETAWAAGAAMVKLFPATLGGPRYVKDLLAPLADVALIATGGITADNAVAFLDAGAVAVAVGSALLAPGEAKRLVDAIRRTG